MRACRRAEDRKLALRLIRISREGIHQQAVLRKLLAQQINPLPLLKRLIIGTDIRTCEQFSNHPRMNIGILAQIKRREVEAKTLHRTDQIIKPPRAHRLAAVRFKRGRNNPQIRRECATIGIRLPRHQCHRNNRMTGKRGKACRRPRINARKGAAIRLITARCRDIAGSFGKRRKFG